MCIWDVCVFTPSTRTCIYVFFVHNTGSVRFELLVLRGPRPAGGAHQHSRHRRALLEVQNSGAPRRLGQRQGITHRYIHGQAWVHTPHIKHIQTNTCADNFLGFREPDTRSYCSDWKIDWVDGWMDSNHFLPYIFRNYSAAYGVFGFLKPLCWLLVLHPLFPRALSQTSGTSSNIYSVFVASNLQRVD